MTSKIPLESSATPTTATNNATYLVNSRLRMSVLGRPASDTPAAAGDAASVGIFGVSGWREIVIPTNLATTDQVVFAAMRHNHPISSQGWTCLALLTKAWKAWRIGPPPLDRTGGGG